MMEDLPTELKINISSFLAAKDVCYFAQTSKYIYEDIDIGLFVHSGSKIGLPDRSWYGATHSDRPYVWASIPLILEKNTHSVIFSCEWRDQGWGNQKGHVYITSRNVPPTSTFEESEKSSSRHLEDEIHTIVAQSNEVCGHRESILQLSFTPQPDKIYELWREVGGGGGHVLYIEDIKIKQLVHGRQNVKVYNSLVNHEFIDDTTGNKLVWKTMIALTEEQLKLEQNRSNEKADTHGPYDSILESLGVTIGNKESLEILHSQCSSLLAGTFFPMAMSLEDENTQDSDYEEEEEEEDNDSYSEEEDNDSYSEEEDDDEDDGRFRFTLYDGEDPPTVTPTPPTEEGYINPFTTTPQNPFLFTLYDGEDPPTVTPTPPTEEGYINPFTTTPQNPFLFTFDGSRMPFRG